MKRTWSRIEKWLAQNAPQISETLSPAATDEKIVWAENHIGCRLPPALKDSYLLHNGATSPGLFGAWELLSLELMVDAWQFLKKLEEQGVFKVVAAQPNISFIKPLWWHERWIPFLYDGCGNYFCLDTIPNRGGARGQIISYYHDDARRRLEAKSFKQWLEDLAHGLEAGGFAVDEYQSLYRRT
jgi:cell wall assembly regulator SMI1